MNISKHVKKGIRKNKKSEQAKSLADAMKKVKTDNHEKKFSKPEAGEKKKKSTKGGGDSTKLSGKKRSYDGASAAAAAKAKAKKQAELDALTPSAKKKRIRQDRQAKKPNFSLVENMKEFWNSARVKTLSKEDREALIAEMMRSVTGRILQVTLRHDASRAVQCILQFGSVQQRRLILEEMSAKLYEVRFTSTFFLFYHVSLCLQPSTGYQLTYRSLHTALLLADRQDSLRPLRRSEGRLLLHIRLRPDAGTQRAPRPLRVSGHQRHRRALLRVCDAALPQEADPGPEG